MIRIQADAVGSDNPQVPNIVIYLFTGVHRFDVLALCRGPDLLSPSNRENRYVGRQRGHWLAQMESSTACGSR
jgi:hypothetical protein